MSKELINNIETLYQRVKEILDNARKNVYYTANFEMVQAYWNVGREIVEEEQVRQEHANRLKHLELHPQSLKLLLENTPPGFFKLILGSIRKAPPPDLLDIWRNHLLDESSPALQEIGLTLFSRFGQSSDASFALSFFSSTEPGVVKAAIDLLQAQAPDQFKKMLESILQSADPQTCIHALQRYGSLAPAEAASHLRSYLFSDNIFLKQSLLPVISLLPYEETKNYLLQFLGFEEFPLLLVLTSIIICSNPQPDVPEKVFEILLSAQGIKAQILQSLLKSLLASIRSAGILEESEETYFAELKKHLQNRRNDSKIQLLVEELRSSDADRYSWPQRPESDEAEVSFQPRRPKYGPC